LSGSLVAPLMDEFSPFVRVVITLLFMALLVAASVIPGRAQPGDSIFVYAVAKTPTFVQKTMHICLYGLLTLLWVWTLDAVESRMFRFAFAVIIAVSLGAVLEWYQTKVPGRFGTFMDVALNGAGALLGLLAATFLL
jgi:VanZ family protein